MAQMARRRRLRPRITPSVERTPPPSTISLLATLLAAFEGQPLALPQLTEPSPERVLLLGVLGVCVRTDRWMESWRAARVTGAARGDSADGQRDIFGDTSPDQGKPA